MSSFQKFFPGFLLSFLVSISINAQYILTDDDVVVEDGYIVSTSIGYSHRDIIIPDTLDNQEIIGIGENSFRIINLSSIHLPTSIIEIQKFAFQNNQIHHINLSHCINLKYIQDWAFSFNHISSIDISGCYNLIHIGEGAFSDYYIRRFYLPDTTHIEGFNGWIDSYNNEYESGAYLYMSSNDSRGFHVIIQHTLRDEDVIVNNGVITSCSYSFDGNHITIPDYLDGQMITGINGQDKKGVFANKGIVSLILPSNLTYIGSGSFNGNQIKNIDFTRCTNLSHIGSYAFNSNYIDTIIDFSRCPKLEYIGRCAFQANRIDSVTFTNCINLSLIDTGAFYKNNIKHLNLNPCKRLEKIKRAAFSVNNIISVKIDSCTQLEEIGYASFLGTSNHITLPYTNNSGIENWFDFNGNIYTPGDTVADFETAYKMLRHYTLSDEDVEVEHGIILSCAQNIHDGGLSIPDTLDGQYIVGIANAEANFGVFQNKNLISLCLPSGIRNIGNYAFSDNILKSISIGHCYSLDSIGVSAFSNNNIEIIDFNNFTELSYIGVYSFKNNKLHEIRFDSCGSLATIGYGAFMGNITYSFKIPSFISRDFSAWIDGEDNIIYPGTWVNVNSYYKALTPFTLGAGQVEIINGIITRYYGRETAINIPSVISDQQVRGIAHGVFSDKEINFLELPNSLQSIDDFAFSHNELVELNLPDSLTFIGNGSFNNNRIERVNGKLSNGIIYARKSDFQIDSTTIVSYGGASNVIDFIPSTTLFINEESFRYNNITSISFQTCPDLFYIGKEAFIDNKITEVSFSNCTWLHIIDTSAFYHNNIDFLDLTHCQNLSYLGYRAFSGNNIKSLEFHPNSSLIYLGSDVFSANELININFSACKNLEFIGNNCFKANAIRRIYFDGCKSLEIIGMSAFENNWINNLDITMCSSLRIVGNRAFSSNGLTSFALPPGIWKDWHDRYVNSPSLVVSDLDSYYLREGYPINGQFCKPSRTEINVYPNPANDFAVIPNTNLEPICIIASSGKVIDIIPAISTSQVINIQKYPNGLYHIRMGQKTFQLSIIH